MYLVTNVFNLKLFKPSMLTKEDEVKGQVFPSIGNISPSTMN